MALSAQLGPLFGAEPWCAQVGALPAHLTLHAVRGLSPEKARRSAEATTPKSRDNNRSVPRVLGQKWCEEI